MLEDNIFLDSSHVSDYILITLGKRNKMQIEIISAAMEIFLAILLRTAGEVASANAPLDSRSKRLQEKKLRWMEEI